MARSAEERLGLEAWRRTEPEEIQLGTCERMRYRREIRREKNDPYLQVTQLKIKNKNFHLVDGGLTGYVFAE